jgi:hypothetical protein
MPRPHPAEELFFCEEQAVGFQQDQKEIEGARADYDRNTVGQQLAPAQQHAETGEFERRVGCCRTRPVCVLGLSAEALTVRLGARAALAGADADKLGARTRRGRRGR